MRFDTDHHKKPQTALGKGDLPVSCHVLSWVDPGHEVGEAGAVWVLLLSGLDGGRERKGCAARKPPAARRAAHTNSGRRGLTRCCVSQRPDLGLGRGQ